MATAPSVYRLSPTQEAMLSQSLLHGDAAFYVEQVDCILRGDLRLNHFEDSWQRVVNRHESCRTAFAWRTTESPVQVVGTFVRLPIDIQDWRNLSVEQQQSQFAEYAERERIRGFELSKAPLMRLALLRTGIDSYRFLWTHHHLILDGWSISPLLSDFWKIYEALRDGKEPSLPPPTPYRRYIDWLSARDLASEERFWRRRLEQLPRRSRPRSTRVARAPEHPPMGDFTKEVGPPLMQRLEALARQLYITPNICLQAAFGIVLRERTHNSDIVFGTTVSGRPPQLEGYESMVGVFINTIPVRMRIPAAGRLSDWLQAEQTAFTEQVSFSSASLSDIHRWSGLPLNIPLFDSIFVFQNYPLNSAVLGSHQDLAILDVKPLIRTKYPLTVMAMRNAGLRFDFAFDRGHFDIQEVECMADRFILILETMTGDPHMPVSALPHLASGQSNSNAQDADLLPEKAVSFNEPASLLDIMLTLWKRTLQTDSLGVDDHFFGTGFNSLAATFLVSRIRDTFQVPLKISDLFEAPTPRAISDKVRDMIDTGPSPVSSPTPAPRNPLMPGSLAQQRIWIAEKLNQAPGALNMPLALHLEGDLKPGTLEAAVDGLLKRHEILRTSLIDVEGIPMQKIMDSLRMPLYFLDVSAFGSEASVEAHSDFLSRIIRAPFDLSQAPLMRIVVVRHSPTSHTLLLVIHHIIGDLWSFTVLAKDLFAIYDGIESETPPALCALSVQYADYASWERELDQSGAFDHQLAWWRENLRDLQPLNLPSKVSDASGPIRGATYRFDISQEIAEGIRGLARKSETTVFLTLLAAFALGVRRASGQDEFAVATNVTERTESWAEPIIGCFVNQILLRIRVDGNGSLQDLLAQLRQTAIHAYSRQQTPFERVAQVMRSTWKTRTNLPQILFSLQQAPHSGSLSSHLSVTLAEAIHDSSRLDLALFLHEGTDDGLRGYWTYNANLYGEAFVSRFSEYFSNLLHAIVRQGYDTITQLETAADQKRQRSSDMRFVPRSRASYRPIEAGSDVV
jgi:non-ribosomal peptide synthetase component F